MATIKSGNLTVNGKVANLPKAHVKLLGSLFGISTLKAESARDSIADATKSAEALIKALGDKAKPAEVTISLFDDIDKQATEFSLGDFDKIVTEMTKGHTELDKAESYVRRPVRKTGRGMKAEEPDLAIELDI